MADATAWHSPAAPPPVGLGREVCRTLRRLAGEQTTQRPPVPTRHSSQQLARANAALTGRATGRRWCNQGPYAWKATTHPSRMACWENRLHFAHVQNALGREHGVCLFHGKQNTPMVFFLKQEKKLRTHLYLTLSL